MIRKIVPILLSGMICLLGVIPALAGTLGSWPTLEAYEKATGNKIEKFSESPVLKPLVAAGELPSVKERLPEEPVVIEPVEEIGQYGGTAYVGRLAAVGLDDAVMVIGIENLLRIAPDYKTIIPGIAKAWELSKDGKTLTLHLRKGIKWSDGVPFTADDIMFWWEDIVGNDELSPGKPTEWCPGNELATFRKIDDYTIRVNFAAPNPLIEKALAHNITYSPKHYLKQFHPRYVSMDKLEKMVKEADFDYWYELFGSKDSYDLGIPVEAGLPTLGAFYLKEYGTQVCLFERNPYYWKIDTAGNQLPYIDEVVLTHFVDLELHQAKISSGDYSFASFHTSLENYPLYMENAEKGNYRVLLWKSAYGSACFYQPNQTCEDLVLREIFQDVRFRRALSLAINREEINNLVFFGKGVPRQSTVLPESSYFEPEFAQAYAQYAPEEANRLLDEMNLEWDENHEYRLRPDGERLAWILEYYPGEVPAKTAISELVKEYWKKIGCQMFIKAVSGEICHARVPANRVQMNLWHLDTVTDIAFPLHASWFVPYKVGWWATNIAPLWARWYETKGEEGEEPPEEIKQLCKWWEEAKITVDEKERIRLGKKVLAFNAEYLWGIGTVGMPPWTLIVKNNLRNIPETGLWSFECLFSYPSRPEQYFFKQK